MKVFRIADARHPIFDGTGAKLLGGRWNSPGLAVIYASENLSCARLEQLARLQLSKLPPSQRWIEITIPDDLTIEHFDPASMPGWNAIDCLISRDFGDRWLRECRAPVLLVPSLAAPGEHNVLISPRHSDFGRISASKERELIWDERLFERR